MKLVVVSSAPFIYKKNSIYAYSPYVNELIIWQNHIDGIAFCCPTWPNDKGLLITEIPFKIEKQFALIDFNMTTLSNSFKAFFYSFYNFFVLYQAMKSADHIHLRCPGNVGLLGSVVQLLFPKTLKTTKYAGNWDPKSKQPWSYRLQKWIISNPLLTRNMQVLVYGEWEGSTKNIKPFFTATYAEADKVPVLGKDLKTDIDFIFVGTLAKGKNPLYAIQLIENLHHTGYKVRLKIYGDGEQRKVLEQYITTHRLEEIVRLEGNQTKEIVQMAYQKSHFVVLPSDSEGWPKAIAEGMFWGCVPIATSVSCVPFMLDNGKRGVLLEMNLEKDSIQIKTLMQNQIDFESMQKRAMDWSRKYTIDVFESEIKKILLS